jgi:cell wall-associated NlpC family hydrolase
VIRQCKAIVTVQKGKGGLTQYGVRRVESYTTDESMDQDADTFTVQIDDSNRELEAALDRDNEVRVNLFINNAADRFVPIFTGLADTVERDQTYLMTITGRDTPSALAVDTDALPQRWKNVMPQAFIQGQAHTLGISTTEIAKMSRINSLYTDGTETVWAFWYRIARMREMYMWTNHLSGGTLIVDKLGYSLSPSYLFGDPPKGFPRNEWQPIEQIDQISTKQGRQRRVIIYGKTAKKGKVLGFAINGQAIDTTIRNWKRQPTSVLTSTVDNTVAELHKRAGALVFEGIVGALEWQLTIHDQGQLIQQNKMCRINMPHYMLVGNYFVVGVTRTGNANGMTQVVRIREKGFALSKRVPDAPVLAKTSTSVSDDYKPATSISASLSSSGIRWADSFVRATREYGGSWDFAVFLGALLSMCDIETGFHNIRQDSSGPSHIEWYQPPSAPNAFGSADLLNPNAFGTADLLNPTYGTGAMRKYSLDFANEPNNPDNPMAPNQAGVGPMQLTDQSIKDFADNLGWNGAAAKGELDGGRWNPDSNIRAAGYLLFQKGLIQPVTDPTQADQIWINVERYNGSGPAAQAYAAKARALYNSQYGKDALASVSAPLVKAIAPGSTDTNVNIPGHGQLVLPDNTPVEARKAIAFALSHLGDPYRTAGDGSTYGGTEPLYDCSSFVTAALAASSPKIKSELDYPYPGHHGDTTFSLFTTGRFQDVAKDALLPADLVFFVGSDGTQTSPGHVGMYLDDNLFIDDPTTGQFVGVHGLSEDYYRQTYVGARRIISWSTGGN